MTQRKTYRAKWLLPDPWTVLENAHVVMAGGNVETVGTGRPPQDTPVIDLGFGALMAPWINAHTHLELSALKNTLPLDKGFRQWTSELIRNRAELSESAILDSAENAIRHLLKLGCGAVGEISTLNMTKGLLRDARLGGVFFHEFLGNQHPEPTQAEKNDTLFFSLAVHAPHTSSPTLFRDINRLTASQGLPISIHLAESEEEVLFIQTARGDWADFLISRGIDFSQWPIPAESPVKYLHKMDVLNSRTLAVHLLHCSKEDMEILRKNDVSICFCPRSNLLLHGKLPDIPNFLALGFNPCIGTDSLASCPSLSILDEMSFVFNRYHGISPNDILAMGTVYGAAALGLENRFGRLAPGFAAPPLYVDIETDSSKNVPQAIASSGDPLIPKHRENCDQ